jgi:hypothetical protein
MTGRGSRLAVFAAATILAGCVEPLPPFADGSLYVTVATTGGDFDTNGYALELDGVPISQVAINQTLLLERLFTGTHTVELTNLASNCQVDDNPRSVTLSGGTILDVAFDVSCVVTGVWIVVSTTGTDFPPSYLVSLDGLASLSVPSNSSALIGRLSPGPHTVTISSLTPNCSATGSTSIGVDLTSGQTTLIYFAVSCGYATAAVAVSASTAGFDLPSSRYELWVGGSRRGSLAINGDTILGGISTGSHTLELRNVPKNCTVAANPMSAIVTTGGAVRDTADVDFAVTCARSGSIAASVATSGLDVPRRAYRLAVDGGYTDSLAIGGSSVTQGVVEGDHTVELLQVPPNCSVTSANPVTVTVNPVVSDTTDVAFAVSCTRVWDLAFTRDPSGGNGGTAAIHVARADGADVSFFAWGAGAAWSPDGATIAFTACTWSYDYYYYEQACYPSGLAVASTGSSTITLITPGSADVEPSWSPDGSRLAFTRGGQLLVIDADGSNPREVPRPLGLRTVQQPAWSPDGTELAFTCQVDLGHYDICVISPDGSGFRRLTDEHGAAGPTWNPDGSSIAYSRTGGPTQIALIGPDGTGETILATPINAQDPAWSPDGSALSFVGVGCNTVTGCQKIGIFRMGRDGSGLTQLTSASDDAPAWRP